MFDTYLRGHHLGSLCVAGFIEILAFFLGHCLTNMRLYGSDRLWWEVINCLFAGM